MLFFLIGFMGSGKSYWGKLWADNTGIPFFDLDHMIEAAEGSTIANLFEEKGENWFRAKESEVLRSFSSVAEAIIACGGGTPCFNDNMEWMNTQGRTIYLSASANYIYDRVLPEVNKRPVLDKANRAELLFFIEQKLKERNGFYEKASSILDVTTLKPASFRELILNN